MEVTGLAWEAGQNSGYKLRQGSTGEKDRGRKGKGSQKKKRKSKLMVEKEEEKGQKGRRKGSGGVPVVVQWKQI